MRHWLHPRLLAGFLLLFAAGCAGLDTTGFDPDGLSDADLESMILNRLEADYITRRQGFGAEVRNGSAVLFGVVRDEALRARALNIARGTPGVTDVKDQLHTR